MAERGVERNIALHISHFMSISAIIERSDLIAIQLSSVAHINEKHAAERMAEPPVEIPMYSLKHHWHARNQKDPRHAWLRKEVVGIFGVEESPLDILFSNFKDDYTLQKENAFYRR